MMMPTITETILADMDKIPLVASAAIVEMLSIITAKIQTVMM